MTVQLNTHSAFFNTLLEREVIPRTADEPGDLTQFVPALIG